MSTVFVHSITDIWDITVTLCVGIQKALRKSTIYWTVQMLPLWSSLSFIIAILSALLYLFVMLCSLGFDFLHTQHGVTALNMAVQMKNADVIDALILAGANLDLAEHVSTLM